MNPGGDEAPRGLATPLLALRGVGPARSRALAERGYRTVGDLLHHLPFRYEDRRTLSKIAELSEPGEYTFQGRLSSLSRVRLRRRGLSMVRGALEDESGQLAAVWFNRPYLPNQVEEGAEYLLHGTVRSRGETLELINATCERPEAASVTRGVVPIYPAVAGLGPATLRGLIDRSLALADLPSSLADDLPRELLARHDLPKLGEALLELHRPPTDVDVEALNERRSPAHRRLIYGELFDQQLELGLSRAAVRRRSKPHRYAALARLEGLTATLPPFELTGAQKRAVSEIWADLGREQPMQRLLQGDVGCGKTIVAVLALVAAVESGLQAALMAPTEILAEQHHRSLLELLGDRYRLTLLTGSTDDSALARSELASGEAQIVIGTHALIQRRVAFERLGLVVVDEQHRFGVAQRQKLQSKGERPDLLVMTATPIPRSLALTLYGDLDLSVIDELPPGRQPVKTRVVPSSKRGRVYEWLDSRLAGGSRAYVVIPLIEESERVEAASIARVGAQLARKLSTHAPAVLHGRTPLAERQAILHDFARGRVRVLIATTIVEVGLDVPQADIMIIESAERFGLSQLHQLRGRVGRGSKASRCVALHGKLSPEGSSRLEAFEATTDGFEIAEADMRIRGPGDLLGTRQSGVPMFRLADLARDRRWLEDARNDARELLRERAESYPRLWERIQGRQEGRFDRLTGG
jgi:ATP-dependent DNA helicase RecG